MVFNTHKEPDTVYVLACPREDGTIAILCRTTGAKEGPAYCQNKKEALSLKTKLVNDPRSIANHRALEIIKNLYIYKIRADINPAWEPGLMWAYLPNEYASCVEAQSMF